MRLSIKLLIILFWVLSIIVSIIWTFENPEKIDKLKDLIKKNKIPSINKVETNEEHYLANAYEISLEKIINFTDKVAFLEYAHADNSFKEENIKIFSQKGFVIENLVPRKLLLPSYFTLQRNGGVKTVIAFEESKIALISGEKRNCFFASLILLNDGREIFKTECLKEAGKKNDFNGIGSSNAHDEKYIYFTLGTVEKNFSKNSYLAQDDKSFFGKVLKIDKNNLSQVINKKKNFLNVEIYTKGHRAPQGLTKINNVLFNVEHGPKGGDELNRLIEGKNYGWPLVSYGTKYLKDEGGDGSSYDLNHYKNKFQEPILALVPSIGISSINNCPKVLVDFFNRKECLIALSLNGNNLRKGNSIIVFLLNENLDKIDSFEIIKLGNHVWRHFMTNKINELYEDEEGNIYISADNEGIFKVKFENFR